MHILFAHECTKKQSENIFGVGKFFATTFLKQRITSHLDLNSIPNVPTAKPLLTGMRFSAHYFYFVVLHAGGIFETRVSGNNSLETAISCYLGSFF